MAIDQHCGGFNKIALLGYVLDGPAISSEIGSYLYCYGVMLSIV